jgi:putative glycosyltransferase (TIGR04372 family)
LEIQGRSFLKKCGMPDGAWFVFVPCTDFGIYRSPKQDLRNVSIESFKDAISHITSQGGWVVRMGDPTMPRLPEMPQVLDYAHHPDRIDCARRVPKRPDACAFLGCASGPYSIAATFSNTYEPVSA